MLDLLVKGGRVITPAGAGEWDVGVAGGRIAAIVAPGQLDGTAPARVVDARGKIVMPGGIDPHVHCSWAMPPIGGGAPHLSGPPEQVSRAAICGGTTTMVDFAVWTHGQTLREALERRHLDWRGHCYTDYAYHLMVQGKIPPEILGELPEAIQAGYPSIKIFTTDITPSRRGRMIHYGDIWEILKVVAREGGIGAIHAEDNDIVMHMYEKLIREGRTSFVHMAEVHNTLSEDLAFRRVIRLAENIEGCALYMMHVSAASGASAVAQSRARGFPIYAESLHQYMLYSSDDYRRPNGQMYHTYPSLKSVEDNRALWEAAATGTIQTIATDEICCTLALKLQGSRIDDTTGGNSGVQPRIAIMYTEMVGKRGYSLQKFAEMVSTNAAKILGMYPKKGAIMVGSDADMALLALEPRVVRNADLAETDYTPWEGRPVAAWPLTTILRGKVVLDQGRFCGDLGDGELVLRRVPEEIRRAPAV